jgi:hypothetical protein
MEINPINDVFMQLVQQIDVAHLGIQYMDIDLGQIDTVREDKPIECPGILFRLDDVVWKDKNPTLQIGMLNVTLKVVFRFEREEDNFEGIKTRVEAKEALLILNQLHEVIQAIRFSSFTRLLRYNQYTIKTKHQSNYWVQVMEYRCNVQSDGNVDDPENTEIFFSENDKDASYFEKREFGMRSR